MENTIPIFNIISSILLLLAVGILLIRYKKLRNKAHLLLAFSLILLVLSTVTNIFEHLKINPQFDLLEDLLKILFIPIFIFSIHSVIIQDELKKRKLSEKKFKAIFNQAFTLIGLLDREGYLIEANESAAKFANITPGQAQGLYFADAPWWQHSETEKQKVIDAIAKVKKGGLVRFETSHISPSGNIHYIDFSLKPMYDDDGKLLFLIPEGRDITEIKLARLELEKHKDNLEMLVKDRTEELEVVNEEIRAINEEIYDNNLLLEKSNQELTKNKAELESTLKRLHDTQDQLIQSEKLASVGILTAGIAHEINNPINFISSGAIGLRKALLKLEKLINEYKASILNLNNPVIEEQINKIDSTYTKEKNIEAIKALMNNIEVGVKRTVDIIGSLRFFIQSTNGDKTIIDIHEVIESVLTILHNEYKNRIVIERKFNLNEGIKCIPGKINQVIMNIVSNAIQATPEDGKITIETRTNNSHAEILISDTGIGITEENISKIFDPFFTTKPVGKGTGLGLSISYKIILEHNGTIIVNSSIGKGSQFTISLPLKSS